MIEDRTFVRLSSGNGDVPELMVNFPRAFDGDGETCAVTSLDRIESHVVVFVKQAANFLGRLIRKKISHQIDVFDGVGVISCDVAHARVAVRDAAK